MGKISFIHKVGKTLEKNGAVLFKESTKSDSIYYDFCGNRIRVSDHLSPMATSTIPLNIVKVSNNQNGAVVCMNNTVMVYNTMKDLNNFIKSFCDIVRCGNHGLLQLCACEIKQKKQVLERIKNDIRENNLVLGKLTGEINAKRKILNAIGNKIADADFDSLNEKQKANIITTINAFTKQNARIAKKKAIQ